MIVPAYNAATTIARCIVSVLNQTFPDFELLVVDDASSDGTPRVISKTADQRIKLLRNEKNQGPSRSRNRALEQATGDFVVFLDADDWFDPDFLEAASEAFAADEQLDYLAVRYRLVGECGALIDRQSYRGDDALRAFLEDRIVSAVWSKAFRKRIIDDFAIRSPDLPLEPGLLPGFEDSAFNVAFLQHCRGAVLLDRALYNYEKRNPSATTRRFDFDAVHTLERSHALVLQVLGERANVYSHELGAREFRMMAVNGISRLAADLRAGFGEPATQRSFQRYLRDRISFQKAMFNPLLKAREKALYFLFLVSPRPTLKLLAALRY